MARPERAMFVDVIRLLLFPAVMAFAASTDLFTMKISNRIPLILICGFCVLAVFDGMPIVEVGSHLAAGTVVLVACFLFFARRRSSRGGDYAMAGLGSSL